jgi:glycosyltransferase involved in cell wall biosynthesis
LVHLSSSVNVPLAPVAESQAAPPATIRVLHVINGEHYAGAERVQDLLAKQLPAMGFSVGFACVKLDMFDELRKSREAPLYDVPMFSKIDFVAAAKVARIAREHNYRVIHGHTARTAMVGGLASMLAKVPLIYHSHSPSSQNTTHRIFDRINSIVERLSLQRAVRVIAVSQAMAEHLRREGVDPARIAVVPNGVPAITGLPDRDPPSGQWMLGTVALFRPRKGIEVLLDAMAILRKKGRPVHLRAVGTFESSKYRAEITARVQKLGLSEHITWTGFSGNVTDELLRMDLFVLPSLFGEGLPMAVLEAMAAGVPVVATRASGVPEAIRDGRDGVLATPGDAADLARAMDEIIDGRYNWSALRASAMSRHAAEFSDRAMAAGVAAVYRDVLGVPALPS